MRFIVDWNTEPSIEFDTGWILECLLTLGSHAPYLVLLYHIHFLLPQYQLHYAIAQQEHSAMTHALISSGCIGEGISTCWKFENILSIYPETIWYTGNDVIPLHNCRNDNLIWHWLLYSWSKKYILSDFMLLSWESQSPCLTNKQTYYLT